MTISRMTQYVAFAIFSMCYMSNVLNRTTNADETDSVNIILSSYNNWVKNISTIQFEYTATTNSEYDNNTLYSENGTIKLLEEQRCFYRHITIKYADSSETSEIVILKDSPLCSFSIADIGNENVNEREIIGYLKRNTKFENDLSRSLDIFNLLFSKRWV